MWRRDRNRRTSPSVERRLLCRLSREDGDDCEDIVGVGARRFVLEEEASGGVATKLVDVEAVGDAGGEVIITEGNGETVDSGRSGDT